MKINVVFRNKKSAPKLTKSAKTVTDKLGQMKKDAPKVAADIVTDIPVKLSELPKKVAQIPDKLAQLPEKVAEIPAKVSAVADDVKYDIDAIVERDPASRSRIEAALLYSGFHARMAHRVSHALNEHGAHFTARMISQGAKFFTGIEIHPGATIGKGLFIDHGAGVVIGETAIIGDNCTLYQGVTLGGTGKETGKRHPTLGNNVMVGAGAKLLGNFTVGDNTKIAAGAVVLGDVPENSTAVGIPAKVVRRGGQKVTDEVDLDQTHIPDPVSLSLCRMEMEIERLKKKVAEIEDGTDDADDASAENAGE